MDACKEPGLEPLLPVPPICHDLVTDAGNPFSKGTQIFRRFIAVGDLVVVQQVFFFCAPAGRGWA